PVSGCPPLIVAGHFSPENLISVKIVPSVGLNTTSGLPAVVPVIALVSMVEGTEHFSESGANSAQPLKEIALAVSVASASNGFSCKAKPSVALVSEHTRWTVDSPSFASSNDSGSASCVSVKVSSPTSSRKFVPFSALSQQKAGLPSPEHISSDNVKAADASAGELEVHTIRHDPKTSSALRLSLRIG